MPDETGFRSRPGAVRAYGPPVFTQWTDDGPTGSTPGDHAVARPFVPASRPGRATPEAAGAGIELDAPAYADRSAAPSPEEDGIPPDAFFVPGEATGHGRAAVAAGSRSAGLPLQGVAAAVTDLAERLERLARRLRTDGAAALGPGLAGDDRLDAMLTGLLAGYLAGRDE